MCSVISSKISLSGVYVCLLLRAEIDVRAEILTFTYARHNLAIVSYETLYISRTRGCKEVALVEVLITT